MPDVPSVEELPVLSAAELAVRLAEAYRLTGRPGGIAQVERLSARVEELERQARKDSSTSSRPPSSDSPYRKNGTDLWIEVSDKNVYEIRARCVLATRAASPGWRSQSSAAPNRARLPPAPDLGLSTAQAALSAELRAWSPSRTAAPGRYVALVAK